MAVIIQPASNPASRQHFLDTVEKPVNISEYEKFLGKEAVALEKVTKNGETAIWGVTPGTNNANVSKYNKLAIGDLVIFTRDKKIFASGKITYLFRNQELAKHLWGTDDKNQTWEYMYALDTIKKRDITYHALQKAIHSKSGDNFMGFRVLDRKKSIGVLDLLGEFEEQDVWDIKIGDVIKRKDLHKKYGGAQYGGIEPSAKTPNILLFTNPYKNSEYGYNFDKELEDGTLTYTGDGQIGNQDPNIGGNKAILEHRKIRRSLRVFETTKTQTFVRYIGEFELGLPEYEVRKAPDKNKNERDVLVFNLNPIGVTTAVGRADREPSVGGIRKRSSEQNLNESHTRKSYVINSVTERREIQLQDRYKSYVKLLNQDIDTLEIQLPGSGTILKPDLVNFTTMEVIEVKSGVSRMYIREAVGQVLDYVFQIKALEKQIFTPAILVPGRLSEDLNNLLISLKISVIYEKSNGEFERVSS